jgi:hypothetical protein
MTYDQRTLFNEEQSLCASSLPGDQPVDEFLADSGVADSPSDELSDQTYSRRFYLFGLSAALKRVSPSEDRREDE